MRRFVIPALLMLAAAPALAQKVSIHYDEDFDFTQISTYQWAESQQAAENPLVHQRVVSGVDYHLLMNGAHKVDSDPDIYVAYVGSAREEVKVDGPNLGFSYGPGWGGLYGPGGTEATASTSVTYREGTLIILAWEADNNHVIWQGSATDVVPETPEKLEKKINKALEKMFSKWEKMVAKGL